MEVEQTVVLSLKQPDFLAMIAPLTVKHLLSVKSAMDVSIRVCRLSSLGYHMGAVFPSYARELSLVLAEQVVKAPAQLGQLPFQ